MKVADILAAKGSQVVTGHGDVTVLDAATLLSDAHIGVLPIVDDAQQVIGTLSERDVVQGVGTRGRAFLDLQVGHVMNRRFLTCGVDDDVRDVMATITNSRTRHLPVVNTFGVLVGIVSIGDVLKSLLDTRELEVRVLRDYYVAHH